jgi:hypothetical protein
MVYLNDKYIPKLIALLEGFKYQKKEKKKIYFQSTWWRKK